MRHSAVQNADKRHLVRLLRLASERRKRETERENEHEPDQPHGQLGGIWLAGVERTADRWTRPSWSSMDYSMT